MKQETLNKLIKDTSNLNFKVYGLQNQAEKALKFIESLLNNGIPLKNIDVCDWSSCGVHVYICRMPYLNKMIFKKYKRFSQTDLINTLKFYRGVK